MKDNGVPINTGAVLLVLLALVLAIRGPAAARADDAQTMVIGNFSGADPDSGPPPPWEPLNFKKIERQTEYRLVRMDGTTVIKAESDDAASGLVNKINVDAARYPILTWRWRVADIVAQGDASRKEGDDFAARIYVTFQYDPEKVGFWDKVKYDAVRLLYGEHPPLNSLIYIWGNIAEKGAFIPNAYTEKAMMIVVESGTERTGQWIEERRNIFEDYKAAFGFEPPMMTGIAIMTDTDDTGGTATAYFGDIFLRQ